MAVQDLGNLSVSAACSQRLLWARPAQPLGVWLSSTETPAWGR